MNARFRPLRWTAPSTPDDQRRSRWTFKASWSDTLTLLERELGYLDGRDVVIEADFTEADIRLDGWPRANARNPVHPGIRIAFDSVHGPLVYATDSCAFWQHNVRSIALGLESLRAVDRYGVTRRGEQYTGWRQIGPGTTAPPAFTTVEDAWEHLLSVAEFFPMPWPVNDPRHVRQVVTRARRVTHPDTGGSTAAFAQVQAAASLVEQGAS
jgi:hypothetical protein